MPTNPPEPYPWPGGGPSRHDVLVAALVQSNSSGPLMATSARYRHAIETLAHMLPAMLTGLARSAMATDAVDAANAAAAAHAVGDVAQGIDPAAFQLTDDDLAKLLGEDPPGDPSGT